MNSKSRAALEAKVKKSFSKYYDSSCETVLSEHLQDPRRIYYLRPSSFPFCGVRRFLDYPEFLGQEGLSHMDAGMLFYVTVGHAFHAVFQEILGKHGQVIGNWRCPKCKSIKTFTTYKRCKACNVPRQYRELEVKYKRTLIGHLDGLYLDTATNTYWVIDYKSTSSRQIWWHQKKEAVYPYKDNVAQIKSYVPLIEREFGIKVSGYMLVYLPRDNPFKGKIVCIKALGTKAKAKIVDVLDRYVATHRRLLVSHTIKDFKHLYEHKLCLDAEDYKKNVHSQYDPCPHHTVCFRPPKMLAKAEKALSSCKFYPMIKQAPEDIIQDLGLKP